MVGLAPSPGVEIRQNGQWQIIQVALLGHLGVCQPSWAPICRPVQEAEKFLMVRTFALDCSSDAEEPGRDYVNMAWSPRTWGSHTARANDVLVAFYETCHFTRYGELCVEFLSSVSLVRSIDRRAAGAGLRSSKKNLVLWNKLTHLQ